MRSIAGSAGRPSQSSFASRARTCSDNMFVSAACRSRIQTAQFHGLVIIH